MCNIIKIKHSWSKDLDKNSKSMQIAGVATYGRNHTRLTGGKPKWLTYLAEVAIPIASGNNSWLLYGDVF